MRNMKTSANMIAGALPLNTAPDLRSGIGMRRKRANRFLILYMENKLE